MFIKAKGITLNELMITVVILGILATLAVPNFIQAMEKTKVRIAVTSLEQIRHGEIIYRADENTFWPQGPSVSDHNTINQKLRLDLDLRKDSWEYIVSSTASDQFDAKALRNNGPYATQWIAIKEDGILHFDNWNGPKP